MLKFIILLALLTSVGIGIGYALVRWIDSLIEDSE